MPWGGRHRPAIGTATELAPDNLGGLARTEYGGEGAQAIPNGYRQDGQYATIESSNDDEYDAAIIIWLESRMRATINIDDELLAEAQRVTGVSERAALVREGLAALIQRESARRLAKLGGTEPQLDDIPRNRPEQR